MPLLEKWSPSVAYLTDARDLFLALHDRSYVVDVDDESDELLSVLGEVALGLVEGVGGEVHLEGASRVALPYVAHEHRVHMSHLRFFSLAAGNGLGDI